MKVSFTYEVFLDDVVDEYFIEAYQSNKLRLKGFIGLPNIKLSDAISSDCETSLTRKFTLIFENNINKEQGLYFVQFRYVDYFHVGHYFGYPIITVEQIKGWDLSSIYFQANIFENSIQIEALTFNNIQVNNNETFNFNNINYHSKVNIKIFNEVYMKLENNKCLSIYFHPWEDTATLSVKSKI